MLAMYNVSVSRKKTHEYKTGGKKHKHSGIFTDIFFVLERRQCFPNGRKINFFALKEQATFLQNLM